MHGIDYDYTLQRWLKRVNRTVEEKDYFRKSELMQQKPFCHQCYSKEFIFFEKGFAYFVGYNKDENFQSFNLYPSYVNEETWILKINQSFWKRKLTVEAGN